MDIVVYLHLEKSAVECENKRKMKYSINNRNYSRKSVAFLSKNSVIYERKNNTEKRVN